MRNPTFNKTQISTPIRFSKDQGVPGHSAFVCVHDSKVRCLSVLCRAGHADSNLGEVRDVIKQRQYAFPR